MAQAHEVRQRLIDAHGFEEDQIEIKVISVSGDQIQDKALREIGGKGLFTKEIEEALLRGDVDAAIHSMKDMETRFPDGLVLGAVLPREDVRDAFISLKVPSLDALPEGAVVGTSSLRRQAQVRRLRPDVTVVEFRGNVQTRLRKLEEGVADATFLACAGLNRLGLADKITSAIESDQMIPAVAQGAIGVQVRAGENGADSVWAALNHEPTGLCTSVERAFLAALDGSCRTPIAGLARVSNDGRVKFRGMILSPDGAHVGERSFEVNADDALEAARGAGEELLASFDLSLLDQ